MVKRVLAVAVGGGALAVAVLLALPVLLLTVLTVGQPEGTHTDGPEAWGGHSNGKIPLEEMCALPWAPTRYLRCDAAEALTRLDDFYVVEHGKHICVTDAYRDYATQVRLKREKGVYAAEPGTSNHGWGLAVDLCGGVNRFNTPEHDWMARWAPHALWVNPEWARDGKVPDEPWHWEFQGAWDGE